MTNSETSAANGPTPSSSTPAAGGADLRIRLDHDDRRQHLVVEEAFRRDVHEWLRRITGRGRGTRLSEAEWEVELAAANHLWHRGAALQLGGELLVMLLWPGLVKLEQISEGGTRFADRYGLLHVLREFAPPAPSGDIRHGLRKIMDLLGLDRPEDWWSGERMLDVVSERIRQLRPDDGHPVPPENPTMSHEPPNPFDPHSPENIALDIQLGLRRDPYAPLDPAKEVVVKCPVCSAYVPLREGLQSIGHVLGYNLTADHTRGDVYVRTCPGKTAVGQTSR